MRRGAAAALALVAVAIGATAARGTPSSVAAPADLRTNDPTGDAGTAPDISSLTVSNDHGGTLTFQLALAGGDPLAASSRFEMRFDTDRDASTGDAGAEYRWMLAGRGWGFEHWTGSSWQAASAETGATDVATAGTLAFVTFQINASELGGVSSFGVWAQSTNTATGASDRVPNSGEITYETAAPTVTRVDLSVSPVHAVAYLRPGETFSVTSARVVLSDFSDAPAESFTCTASVAGRAIPPKAPCAWRVPTTAGGKTVHVVVQAAYQGGTYSATLQLPVLRKKRR